MSYPLGAVAVNSTGLPSVAVSGAVIVPFKPSGITPSDTNSDVILLVTFSFSVTVALKVIGLYAPPAVFGTKRKVCTPSPRVSVGI